MERSVWLVSSSFEPHTSSLYTLRLAAHLGEHGFRPTIVCASARHVPPRLRTSLDILEVPHLHSAVWRTLHLKRWLAAHTESPPDLLHAQRRSHVPATAILADRLSRPWLATVHEAAPVGESWPRGLTGLRRVIAVSPVIERDLTMQLDVGSAKTAMIACGVELPGEPRPPRPEGITPVVGMASYLERRRGVMYFLMAVDLLVSSGCDAEFVVAGVGPDEGVLRRAARKLDVAHRVTFVGHAFDYRELLSALDVFVAPSVDDGPSTMMLEAMALETPVVAVRAGGISETFADGECILLAPRDHHLALAEKIRQLLDNPAKARAIAAAGREVVRERFSVDRMIAATAELYREILAEAAASPGNAAIAARG